MEDREVNNQHTIVGLGHEIRVSDDDSFEEDREDLSPFKRTLEQLSQNVITHLEFFNIQTNDNSTSYSQRFKTSSHSTSYLATLPNGLLIVCDKNHEVQVVDPESERCLNQFKVDEDVNCFAVLDGTRLATGHMSTLKVWDLENGNCVNALKVEDPIFLIQVLGPHSISTISGFRNEPSWLDYYSISIHGRSWFKRVVKYDLDTMRLWDLEQGTCHNLLVNKCRIKNKYGRTFPVYQLTLLTGNKIVGVLGDHSIQLWEIQKGNLVLHRMYKGHQQFVTGLRELPSGLIATSSADGTVCIWDPERDGCSQVLRGHAREIIAMAISVDGKIISASRDGTLKIWDSNRGICLKTLTDYDYFSAIYGHLNDDVEANIAVLSSGRVVANIGKGFFYIWNPLLIRLTIFQQQKLLSTISSNQSLTSLDLGDISLASLEGGSTTYYFDKFWKVIRLPWEFNYVSSRITVRLHPTLKIFRCDPIKLRPNELTKLLFSVFKNQSILEVWLKGEVIKRNGRVIRNQSVSDLFSDAFKKHLYEQLKNESKRCFEKGFYTEALVFQEIAVALNLVEVSGFGYQPTAIPFKSCSEQLIEGTSYYYFTPEREARNQFIAAMTDSTKALVEQIFDGLEAVFKLKFLWTQSSDQLDLDGQAILPWQSNLEGWLIEFCIDDLLAGWLLFNQGTWLEHQRIIHCLIDFYAKKWSGDKWLPIEKLAINRMLLLLQNSESFLKTTSNEQDFLRLLATIEAKLAPNESPSLGYKPRQYYGLGYCPELRQAIDRFRMQVEGKEVVVSPFNSQPPLKMGVSQSASIEESSQRRPKFKEPLDESKIYSSKDPAIKEGDKKEVLMSSQIALVKRNAPNSIQVKRAPLPKPIPLQDRGMHAFVRCLTRQLSMHRTNAMVATSGFYKVQESGRWEDVKTFAKQATHLMGALAGIGGIAYHLLSHSVTVTNSALEIVKHLFKMAKKLYEACEAGSEMVEIVHHSKERTVVAKLEMEIRKLLGDAPLTQKEQLQQFAIIFGDESDLLPQLIEGLVWRYGEQLARLTGGGGEQLAFLIYQHIKLFFQLEFMEWEERGLFLPLKASYPERVRGMLEVMWYWVGYVHFLKPSKEEDGKLECLQGELVEAVVLLHHAGYKCLNEKSEVLYLDVNVKDIETGKTTTTDGQKWGYRNMNHQEHILDQFVYELEHYRETQIIAESWLIAPQTLKRYEHHPFTEIGCIPFVWQSELERIIQLEREMKLLQETSVPRAEVELVKENLTIKFNEANQKAIQAEKESAAAKNESADAKTVAVKAIGECAKVKTLLVGFVGLFRNRPLAEQDERIGEEANRIWDELSQKNDESQQQNEILAIETMTEPTHNFIEEAEEAPHEPTILDVETPLSPGVVDQSEALEWYGSPVSQPASPRMNVSVSSEEASTDKQESADELHDSLNQFKG